jgi:hypothetical protein
MGALETLITVTRRLSEINGMLPFGQPKSAGGRPTVGVPSLVARLLAVDIVLYLIPGDDGLVFRVPTGTYVAKQLPPPGMEPASAE